ncbi:hypothetical protein ABB26_10095 [Stenotrophomonas humi]|uniref:Uncharacterized protein n=1 Tax=Stenotrophomonas humi TaxID=405444 RepID=A0A0R0C3B7_9GAMM|nr:hypothetical protein ABB26_10095 [Stenotrophomonas humi]
MLGVQWFDGCGRRADMSDRLAFRGRAEDVRAEVVAGDAEALFDSARIFRRYGPSAGHPLAYETGGSPDAFGECGLRSSQINCFSDVGRVHVENIAPLSTCVNSFAHRAIDQPLIASLYA